MVIFLGIFFFLVPFLVIMMLESRKRRVEIENEEGDEEGGQSGFDENPGEELEEGEHHSATKKTKQD